MDEPTKEQQQWFWEQCGWTEHWDYRGENFDPFNYWEEPDQKSGDWKQHELPEIDLNNLFKYAVANKELWKGKLHTRAKILSDWVYAWSEKEQSIENSALALFWAIYKVYKEGVK